LYVKYREADDIVRFDLAIGGTTIKIQTEIGKKSSVTACHRKNCSKYGLITIEKHTQ